MDRFFRGNPPRKGQPISTRGFASGVMAMANALSNMQVIGGHVEWSAWLEPTIVIDQVDSESSGATSVPDGETRWGRVAYVEISHKFVQYKETYSADTNTWTENETPEDITTFISHDTAHGV